MSFYIEVDDQLQRPEPELWLATPNRKIIDRLDGVNDLSVTFDFMNQNEISFNLNAFLFDELKQEQYKNPALHLIKNKYMIRFKYNGQEKWFVIDTLEKTSDEKDYIPVTAVFVGKELDRKHIGDLHEIGVTIRSVLSKVLPAVAPNWGIGYIDPKIANVQREYELSDASVTSLLEEITEKTDSIVIFNDDRTLDFVHEDNAGTFRGLKIEEETYLKGFVDSYDSQNLTTRLVLFGKDGLTINGVNPAGTSYIEDFSYYMKPFRRDSNRNVLEHSAFMSDALCHALLDYEEFFESRRDDFEENSSERTELLREELEADFKLTETTGIKDRLEERYEILKTNNAISQRRIVNSGTHNIALKTNTYYVMLVHNRGTLSQITMNGKTHLISQGEDAYIKVKTRDATRPDDNLTEQAMTILGATTNLEFTIFEAPESDFNESDAEKLDPRYNLRKYRAMYDYDLGVLASIQRRIDTLNNRIQSITHSLNPQNFLAPELYAERENFVSWGVWREENHTDPIELLNDGLVQLAEHNNIERVTNVDIIDFLQSLEDSHNWDKLAVGDIVRFSNKAFDTKIQAFIRRIDIDFDNHNINLEISDVLDIGSKAKAASKRMASFLSTSNQVNLHKREIADNLEKTNQVMKILEGEWDANKQRILAGNETVEISNQGIMITSPTHPNEKLVAVAGVIAISDDGGETFKQAINTRGIVGEQIIGKIIMGTQLVMENDSGTMRFDNDGFRIRADEFHLIADDGNNYFESLLNNLNNQFIEYDKAVKNYIQEQRESFEQETAEFEIAIKNYTSEMMDALSDGVLTAQEMHYLQLQMNLIESEYLQVRSRIVPTIQTNNIDPTIQEKLYQIHHELELDYVYLRDFVRQLEGQEVVVPDETIANIKEMLSRFKPNIEEVTALMDLALQTIQDNRIAQLEYDQKTLSERLTDEFQGELDELKESIEVFDDTFFDAVADGIITEVERRTLSDLLLRLRAEKGDIDARHNSLSGHYMIIDTEEKAELDSSKLELDSGYTALNNLISNLKTQDEISENEIANYQTLYEDYLDKLKDYTAKYEQATIAMQNAYADDKVSQAQAYADGLMKDVQDNVDDVDRRVSDFHEEVFGAFKDGIITESERNRLSVHRDMLVKEKSDVISRYNFIVTHEYLVGYYDLQPLIAHREAFSSTHSELLLTIELAMMDDIITKQESDKAMELFEQYVEDLSEFSTELENAIAVLGESKAVALTMDELESYLSIVDFNDELTKIQSQLDGKIVTHYHNHVPTLNNEPAVNWTPEQYDSKIGDLFYDLDTGRAYRFLKQDDAYGWEQIEDSDVTKALADSQDALDLADSKRRVFIAQPTPPYDIGDLWIDKDQELFRARVQKDEGSNFVLSDWVLATKYTDDSKANAVETQLNSFKTAQQKEVRDLNQALESFEDTVFGSFKDGIITENELRILNLHKQHLDREKADVDAGYNQIIQNTLLVGAPLQQIQTAYNSFNSTHINLLSKIDNAIQDGIITDSEIAEIEQLFVSYDNNLKAYKEKFNDAVLYLIGLAQDEATEAKEEAARYTEWKSSSFETDIETIATRVGRSEWSERFKPDIQQTFDTQLEDLTDELDNKFEEINDNALGLNKALTDSFEDGIITKSEVEVISNSLNILKSDYEDITKRYESVYNNTDLKGTPKTSLQTARNNYNAIYNTLTSLINSVVSAGTISNEQKTTYNNHFTTYQTRIGQFSNALEVALNAITQEKADKASSGAVNDFHENTIKSQYSTTEQTQDMISSSVNAIDLSGELSKVSQGYAEYNVSRTSYANLTEADGSLMDDAFSYEIAVQRKGDDSSLYAAVFSSLGKGKGWEKTELEVKGQTGTHPELYAEDGNIRLRTMGGTSTQDMEVIYTKYIGSFTNMKRVSSQIKQESDNILLEVERATDGKAIVSKINQTPEEIRLSASKIVFEVTGRNLEEEIENIELTPGPRGTGIVETTITYASSSNGTTAPSSGYSSQVPSVSKGNYLWTRTQWKYSDGSIEVSHTPTYMGQDGNSGRDGVPGKDGVGITNTVIRYASSSSGLNAPTSGWSDKIPDVPAGHYLWMRTVWHYSDNTTETAYSVSHSGKEGPRGLRGLEGPKGDQGIEGPKGEDGKSSYTHIAYATGSSGQNFSTSHFSGATYIGMYVSDQPDDSKNWRDYNWTLIKGADGARGIEGPKGDDGRTPYFHTAWANNSTGTSGFSTTVSANKSYIGTATTFEPDDPTDPKAYSWTKIKGDKGDKGEDGTGIDSTAIHYAIHTSGTSTPTSGWSTSVPSPVKGRYMWTRTRVDYTDGTHSTTYSVAYQATDGQKGEDGNGVSSTSVTYAQTTSGTTTPTSWSSTRPSPIKGQYLWTRTIIRYTDGTSSTAYSTSYSALDGQKGDKGDNGDKGDKGERGATGERGPRGATGTSVSSVTEYYLASNSSSGVTTGTSGWTTSIQTISPSRKYLWNYEKINFSDGTSQNTIPVIIGAYGDKGDTGNTGATGRSITGITEYYLASSSKTGVTRSTSGWTTAMQTTTPSKPYLWNYERITWSSGTTTTYVDPIIIGVHGAKGDKGDKGDQGPRGIEGPKGADGQSQYVHVRYSANSSGSGHVPNPTSNTKYIGIAVTNTNSTPSSASAYTWSKYAGEDGAQGPQGIKGDDGKDGQPTYTWIKYADTPTSGMNDYPEGKKYIGLAFNKTTATESKSYSDYAWSLMPQNIEIGGRNLIRDSKEFSRSPSTSGYNYINISNFTEEWIEGQEYTFSSDVEIIQGDFDAITVITRKTNGDSSATVGDLPIINGRIEGSFVASTGDGRLYVYQGISGETQNNEVTLRNVKLEKGNTATDWTPAPEDIDEAINKVDNDLSTTNENLGNLENAMVDKKSVSALENALRQLTESYTKGEEARDKAVEEFQESLAKVPGIEQDLKDTVAKLAGYEGSIILDPNDGKVTIGNNEGSVGVEVTRTAINFIDGGELVARISNQELFISRGVFTRSLTIGEHALADVGNGLTTLTWVG